MPARPSQARSRFAIAILAVTLAGCPKSKDGDRTDGAASASTSASTRPRAEGASGSSTPEGGRAPSPSPGAADAADKAASYSGTYTLAPATLHIPEAKDYAHVKQAKDDPSKFVGEGTLTVSVGADGRVSGEISTGPAAPATIDGARVESEIRGVVRRKTPADDGLTGTLEAKVTGASGTGKLTLAEANASVLREGTVTLTAKGK